MDDGTTTRLDEGSAGTKGEEEGTAAGEEATGTLLEGAGALLPGGEHLPEARFRRERGEAASLSTAGMG